MTSQDESAHPGDTAHATAVARALTLLFGAISDADVVDQSPLPQQKVLLWTWLTRVTADTLKSMMIDLPASSLTYDFIYTNNVADMSLEQCGAHII